jgi:predicted nucleic acid-binding protein
MSSFAIFDTSILIDRLRYGRHVERMHGLGMLVRPCAVVIAELMRGVQDKEEWKFLEILTNSPFIVTPTTSIWLESGEILAQIRAEHGFEPKKLRELHFDVLIALTARAHGALLVTSNGVDFELIRGYRDFPLEVW